MIETKHIHISDYNYPLPDERIAKFPLSQRDHSKLLVYRHGDISEDSFFNLPSYLPQGALMIFNNTKVIQARLHFRKETGALIEVFLLEPALPADYEQMFQTRSSCEWHCLVGNLKKWKAVKLNRTFNVAGHTVTLSAEYVEEERTCHRIRFTWNNEEVSFAEILDAAGELPIPPYLNRATQESDKTTYQTIYSKIKGSVAAPTAGLHFTENVLADIDRPVDVVFLPINGVGNNMNMTDAARFAADIDAKEVVPLHFGMFDALDPTVFASDRRIIPTIYKEIML